MVVAHMRRINNSSQYILYNDLIDHLRNDRPELVGRLIFSTGDSFAPDTAKLLEQSNVPTVAKPFDFSALERLILQVAQHARAH